MSAKRITLDELADLYDKHKGGRRARTLPMDDVIDWAVSRKDLFKVSKDGTIMSIIGEPPITCKKRIGVPNSFGRTRSCKHAAVKDGFCHAHHPDTVNARRAASDKKRAEEQHQSAFQAAHQFIKCRATVGNLRSLQDAINVALLDAKKVTP